MGNISLPGTRFFEPIEGEDVLRYIVALEKY